MSGLHKMFLRLRMPPFERCSTFHINFKDEPHRLCLGICACQFLQCDREQVDVLSHILYPLGLSLQMKHLLRAQQ